MTIDAQLASPHAGLAYLVQMSFASGTVRATNWGHVITWGGFDWLAVNAVTSLTPVRHTERAEYPALDLGLQPANDALLAAVIGDPADYRGRDLLLYLAVLDDSLRLVEDAELVWAGVMDTVRLATGDGAEEEASLVMRCEHQGRDNRAAASLRLNDAQHQRRYPGDTFLSRIEALSGKPVPWLSRRFQQV